MEAPKGGGPNQEWCLKRRGPEMCAFGVLGLSCEATAAPKPHGFHTTAESPNVHISGARSSKHHQNSTRRPPKREERMKIVAGEGKKREILGGPAKGFQRRGSGLGVSGGGRSGGRRSGGEGGLGGGRSGGRAVRGEGGPGEAGPGQGGF